MFEDGHDGLADVVLRGTASLLIMAVLASLESVSVVGAGVLTLARACLEVPWADLLGK